MKERQRRGAEPPAVPVMAAGKVARRVVTSNESRRAIGSAADRVVDPAGWHDLPATYPALVQEQLAESAQVPKRRTDTAVGQRVAAAVDGDIRVELGAHRLP